MGDLSMLELLGLVPLGQRLRLYAEAHPRTPRLSLPFAAADDDGVAW